MTDGLTHIKENSEDTERHLSENRRKFESDCVFLLKLMMTGRRLTTQAVRDMKIDDRRLRNLHESGRCKREWMHNEKGKRTHVEYFCDIAKPPTKKEITSKFSELLRNGKQAEINF